MTTQAAQSSTSATSALYRQRNLPAPPFPAYKASTKKGSDPPTRELRGGHRPAPTSVGTIAEPLASSSRAPTKGPCSIRALGWSIDGRRLASSSSDRSIRIWTPELSTDARATTELRGHTDGVEQIVWNPMHADRLASASGDKHVKFWDTRQVKETASIATPGANINIAFHPHGTYVAVGDRNDTVSVIDARTCKSVRLVRSFGAPPSISAAADDKAGVATWTSTEREEINEFSWTPDGRMFVLGTGSGNVRLLDARSTETMSIDTSSTTSASSRSLSSAEPALNWPLVHTIVGHTATVFCVRADPLGRYMATASADSTTAIWSVDEWFNVSMSGHLTYPARSISFSYDGEFLAAGGEDSFISITATAPMDATAVDSPLHKIPVTSAVNGLTWHPSRHCLAYAGDDRDGTIRIWGMA